MLWADDNLKQAGNTVANTGLMPKELMRAAKNYGYFHGFSWTFTDFHGFSQDSTYFKSCLLTIGWLCMI